MQGTLKEIGTVTYSDMLTIKVDNKYKKGINKIDQFSHLHVFFISDNRLSKVICKMVEVNAKEGVIIAKLYNENTLGLTDNIKAKINYTLVDIKPYMPSEDSVYDSGKFDYKTNIEVFETRDEEKNEIYKVVENNAQVRNIIGDVYIECNFDIIEFKSDYLKVYWWFNKFDKDNFRDIVECDVPYENAPRSGIFLTRSPVRPNPIAFTVIKVKKYDYENKRIYPMSIEAFDKTPCIGIESYNESDFVCDAKVPKYLSHLLDRIDERDMYENLEDISYYDTNLKEVLNSFDDGIKEKIEDKADESPSGIYVKNARVNNLKGVDVFVPYNKITAVVGVSGSGKSSLVGDTIYAECTRKMQGLNNNHEHVAKPDVDDIRGIIPAVYISQNPIRGNSMSTCGTYTDMFEYLRIIYSLVGTRHCPSCGGEIIPLSNDRIKNVVNKFKEYDIYDLDDNKISFEMIDVALEKGAIKLKNNKINDKEIYLQNKQKCFRCNRFMFELTPLTFSYMDSEARCPKCLGSGNIINVDSDKLIKGDDVSVLDGAILLLGKFGSFIKNPNANWMKGQVIALFDYFKEDMKTPWGKLSDEIKNAIIYGFDKEITYTYKNSKNGRVGEITRKPEGIKNLIDRLYKEESSSKTCEKFLKKVECPTCKGERLGKEGRMVTVLGMRYPETAKLSFSEIEDFANKLYKNLTSQEYKKVKNALESLKEIASVAVMLGIGHIRLDRATQTLSGGEASRLKMLSAFSNHLSGILYVLDEPSKGLNKEDYNNIVNMLEKLKKENNTILMVEHNEEMINKADYLIEMGPLAGKNGGEKIAEGRYEDVIKMKNSNTRRYLSLDSYRIIDKHKIDEYISLNNLNKLHLKNINVDIPKRAITCIIGKSGSGKSTLLKQEIYPRLVKSHHFDSVVMADQTAIGKNSKSVIATYTQVMDMIRDRFASTNDARELNYDVSYFSFNSDNGKCPLCSGDGKIAVKYFDNFYVTCSDCHGTRYKKDILQVKYKEKGIAEVLDLSIKEAIEFFSEDENSNIKDILEKLQEVGLDYLKLGQGVSTLSGGEAQRIKLALEFIKTPKQNKNNVLYLLDEPTCGLHFQDIENLIRLMDNLVKQGNTIVVIEHNKQFIQNADYMIKLGPEAGEGGGNVIYKGEVE